MDNTELEKLKKQAEQGDAEVQFQLGRYYDNLDGKSGQEDSAKAVRWYRKAAEQGHAEAQCALAECYLYGKGVPPYGPEALKWFKKAAAGGSDRAQRVLALINRGSSSTVDEIEDAVNTRTPVEDLNREEENNESNESFDSYQTVGILAEMFENE